jgi:hypothetical protein
MRVHACTGMYIGSNLIASTKRIATQTNDDESDRERYGDVSIQVPAESNDFFGSRHVISWWRWCGVGAALVRRRCGVGAAILGGRKIMSQSHVHACTCKYTLIPDGMHKKKIKTIAHFNKVPVSDGERSSDTRIQVLTESDELLNSAHPIL